MSDTEMTCRWCREPGADVRRGLCRPCRRKLDATSFGWRKVARAIEKQEQGIGEPELEGAWHAWEGRWAILIQGHPPGVKVGDVVDVRVHRHKDDTWGTIRGAEVVAEHEWRVAQGDTAWGLIAVPKGRKR